jgi:hypothetical protein
MVAHSHQQDAGDVSTPALPDSGSGGPGNGAIVNTAVYESSSTRLAAAAERLLKLSFRSSSTSYS